MDALFRTLKLEPTDALFSLGSRQDGYVRGDRAQASERPRDDHRGHLFFALRPIHHLFAVYYVYALARGRPPIMCASLGRPLRLAWSWCPVHADGPPPESPSLRAHCAPDSTRHLCALGRVLRGARRRVERAVHGGVAGVGPRVQLAESAAMEVAPTPMPSTIADSA